MAAVDLASWVVTVGEEDERSISGFRPLDRGDLGSETCSLDTGLVEFVETFRESGEVIERGAEPRPPRELRDRRVAVLRVLRVGD